MKTTIDGQGRIELNREIQLQLGVRPGDEVLLESCGNECVIKPSKTTTGLCLEGNVLVHRSTAPGSTESGVVVIRDERFEQLVEGLPR